MRRAGWVIRDGDKMNYILTGYSDKLWREGDRGCGNSSLVGNKSNLVENGNVARLGSLLLLLVAGVKGGGGLGGCCHNPYRRR